MRYKLIDLLESKTQGVNTTTDHISYVDKGYKIVQAKNIAPYNITFDESNFIDEDTFDRIKDNHKLHKGEVLYTNIGSQLGNSAIYEFDDEAIITWNVMKLIPNKDIIDNYYLCYLLNSNKPNIKALNTSSTMPFVSGKELMKVEFDVPDLKTQQKVVKVLKNIEDKIKLNNEINNNLYELAIKYLKEMQSDDEVTLSTFGKIQGGYAFKSKDLLDTKTNNRIIKIKNLLNEISADVVNSQFVEDEVIEKLDNKFKIQRGNVAIAMTGAELGKTGFIYGFDNYYLNQRVGLVRGITREKELYLNILLLSQEFQDLLNSKGYGSAQPNVSTTDIENILIQNIEDENLVKFYEIVSPIYAKIILNCEENLNLEQLRDTLLPKLMNGEIDLDNIVI